MSPDGKGMLNRGLLPAAAQLSSIGQLVFVPAHGFPQAANVGAVQPFRLNYFRLDPRRRFRFLDIASLNQLTVVLITP